MHRFFPASVLPLAVWRASRFARQEIAPTLRIILGCSLMVTPCVTGYGAESTLAEITALMDRSLEPIPVNHAPGPEYSAEVLNYAMARGLEQTHGGRLWAAWVAGGDNDRAFIVAAISDDHGFTWRHPAFVIQSIDSDDTPLRRRPRVSNFWTDPTGRLWFFYDQSMAGFDGRAGLWAMTCDDPDANRPLWSLPRRIWHGSMLNKPIVSKTGDWLLPVTLWARNKISIPLREAHRDLDELRMAHVFVSKDQGTTFERRGGVLIPATDFDEHMLVELRDGRLWLLARSLGGISESFSNDGGRTWSKPGVRFPHVSSRFFIRRLASGNLLFVRHGGINERTPGRSQLRAFLSADDGDSWKGGLMLDDRDRVSYPDGAQNSDGTIFVIYDRDRANAREILVARFTESDVLAPGFQAADSQPRLVVHRARGPAPAKVQ